MGEIGYCNLGTKTIKLHHYIDLGSSGELKDYKPRKALKNRQLFPEYEDVNALSNGYEAVAVVVMSGAYVHYT